MNTLFPGDGRRVLEVVQQFLFRKRWFIERDHDAPSSGVSYDAMN